MTRIQALGCLRGQRLLILLAIVVVPAVPIAKSLKTKGEFRNAFSRLMILTKTYLQLQDQTTIRDLMDEIRTTENKIAFARQGYNDSVETFNAPIQNVPDVFVNRLFLKAESFVFWQVFEKHHKDDGGELAPPLTSPAADPSSLQGPGEPPRRARSAEALRRRDRIHRPAQPLVTR